MKQVEKNLLIFSRYGVRIYVHWTFLVAAICIIIMNAWPGNIDRLFWAVLVVMVLFTSVLLHEAARALMAVWVGIRPGKIVLLPIGGVEAIQRFPDRPWKELVVSAAGPVFSLFLAFIASRFLYLHHYLPNVLLPYEEGNKQYLLFLFYLINLGLGIFSLVPSFPMDGGRILRSLLAMRFNYIRATAIVHQLGKIIAILLIAAAVILQNLLPALIGIFLLTVYPADHSYALIRSMVSGLTAGRVAVKRFYIIPAAAVIGSVREQLSAADNPYFVLERDGISAGAVTRMAVIAAIAAGKSDKPMSVLRIRALPHFDENESLDALLEILARHPDQVFTVLGPGSKVEGVISFRIVMEYLLLHNTHSRKYPIARSLAMVNE